MDTYIEKPPLSRFPSVPLNITDAYGLDGKPRKEMVQTMAQLQEMLDTELFDVEEVKYELNK